MRQGATGWGRRLRTASSAWWTVALCGGMYISTGDGLIGTWNSHSTCLLCMQPSHPLGTGRQRATPSRPRGISQPTSSPHHPPHLLLSRSEFRESGCSLGQPAVSIPAWRSGLPCWACGAHHWDGPQGAAYVRPHVSHYSQLCNSERRLALGWEWGTRAAYLLAFRPFPATQSAGQAGARYTQQVGGSPLRCSRTRVPVIEGSWCGGRVVELG